YPTHASYKDVEKKVKEALCGTPECRAFEESLKKCDAGLMMKSATWIPIVGRYDRSAGLRRIVAQLKSGCPKVDPMYPQSPYNITQMGAVMQVGFAAAALGDCELVSELEKWMRESNAAMSAESLVGVAHCD